MSKNILNYIMIRKSQVFIKFYMIYLINELRTYITQDNTRIIIVFTKNKNIYTFSKMNQLKRSTYMCICMYKCCAKYMYYVYACA